MLIALCGYMGCGKSTVGKLLAEKIGYDFLDTDLYIEENQGKSIPEIFANIGEDGFRKIETQAINNTLELKNTVISLGGGAVLKNENKQLLKNAFVIFLNSSFEDCYTRICNSTRPIVKAKTKEQLQEHFLQRLPHYRAVANVEINENKLNLIVEDILNILKEKL